MKQKTFKDIKEEFKKLLLTDMTALEFIRKQLEEVFDMCVGEEKIMEYYDKEEREMADLLEANKSGCISRMEHNEIAGIDGYNQKRQEIIKLKEEFFK